MGTHEVCTMQCGKSCDCESEWADAATLFYDQPLLPMYTSGLQLPKKRVMHMRMGTQTIFVGPRGLESNARHPSRSP
jgi:hypothetical protein